MQFWKLFFNDEIISQFVKSTNISGRNRKEWIDISTKILFSFMAIIFYMGVVRHPEMRSYWSKDEKYRRNWVGKIMSRDRFTQIWAALHYVDVTTFTEAEKRAKSEADGFWRVAGFVDALAKISGELCHAGRAFDIDEMCIFFKGRHKCRCYNGSKPEKWHFKAFSLNDPTTGYYLNFYLYRGKGELRPHGMSATAYPIFRLLDDSKYHDRWHILATDNWFSSMEVLKICLRRGIHFVGTFRTNKQGIPKHGIYTKSGPLKPKARGDMKCHITTILIERNEETNAHQIYFTAWFDNKEVHMLSSYPVYNGTVVRNSKNKENVYAMLNLSRPSAVKDYNKIMGGTDLGDQLGSYYRFQHQSTKWPHRIYTHFMMLATVNAHILRNWIYPKNTLTLKVFLELLMEELSGSNPFEEKSGESDDDDKEEEVPVKKKLSSTWADD